MNEFCNRLLTAIEIEIQWLETIGADSMMPSESWDRYVQSYWNRRNMFEALQTPLLCLPS